MKNRNLVTLIFAGLLAVVASGCGKDMKVSIRAAESEKDGPAAALVRKVEVTYHDPQGQERVREDVSVLGLSQNVSMRADLLKGVSVEKEGTFTARAYGDDGLLLLKAATHPDPEDSDVVELVLNREASRPSELGATMLRRVRLVGAGQGGEFVRDAGQLRAETDSQQCVELPPLALDEHSGAPPRLVFEGAIKGPSFTLEVGVGLGRETIKMLGEKLAVPLNSLGDGELELGRSFLNGLLLKAPARLRLRIHSDRYEGCLEVKTRPVYAPVTTAFHLDYGYGASQSPQKAQALGVLDLINPNAAAVRVKVTGVATDLETGERLRACVHQSNDPRPYAELRCGRAIQEERLIAPGGRLGVSIFGAFQPSGHLVFHRFEVRWQVTTGLEGEQPTLVSQVPPSLIP